MSWYEGFLWGLMGGGAAEIIGLRDLMRQARSAKIPKHMLSLSYLLVATATIALGGGIAVAYLRSGQDLSPILALNVGVAAPVIIRAASSNAPTVPTGNVD